MRRDLDAIRKRNAEIADAMRQDESLHKLSNCELSRKFNVTHKAIKRLRKREGSPKPFRVEKVQPDGTTILSRVGNTGRGIPKTDRNSFKSTKAKARFDSAIADIESLSESLSVDVCFPKQMALEIAIKELTYLSNRYKEDKLKRRQSFIASARYFVGRSLISRRSERLAVWENAAKRHLDKSKLCHPLRSHT